MWTATVSLAFIISMQTGIVSQSIAHNNDNGLEKKFVSNGIHGDTNTDGSLHSPYRFETKAEEKFKHYMLTRHKQLHGNNTYRTHQDEISRHIHQLEDSDGIVNLGNVSSRLARRQTSQTCKKMPLYVNFRAIGWNWIYSPAGFNAFYCQGECDKPLSEPTAQLYAKVQALADETKASKNKPLCCVPTKTSSLEVEYFKGRNKYTLKMDDIIVEECGCR
ncbi:hypothetical protein ACJMK2_003061 [Sinanodonta woodiana]|uniref:TGF-beta family profile domain-containing protein n=1 Tax=Sinanodonta woodiana TaxID=1069815 RepID=A0ABD3Y0N0_SINWO